MLLYTKYIGIKIETNYYLVVLHKCMMFPLGIKNFSESVRINFRGYVQTIWKHLLSFRTEGPWIEPKRYFSSFSWKLTFQLEKFKGTFFIFLKSCEKREYFLQEIRIMEDFTTIYFEGIYLHIQVGTRIYRNPGGTVSKCNRIFICITCLIFPLKYRVNFVWRKTKNIKSGRS